MKLPRDMSGEQLSRLLGKFGYIVVRQTGSHVRLAREGEHHITIPRHRELKVGTLSGIVGQIAGDVGLTKEDVIRALWGS